MYFEYGETEIEYLRSRDKTLGEVIDKIGHVCRETDSDLFCALVHQIAGQQISTKALATVWQRMNDKLGTIDAVTVSETDISELQSLGISFRKAEYIKDLADKVVNGVVDMEAIRLMSDEDAIKALSSLRGVGVWTAEMLLLFCLRRQNVFSFDDLAIKRGLRMVYHHREITPKLFEKYRRRFSPYCSVASLYLWEVAGGAIPGMKDYAPAAKRR